MTLTMFGRLLAEGYAETDGKHVWLTDLGRGTLIRLRYLRDEGLLK